MKKSLLEHWPLYAALCVLLLALYLSLDTSLRQNQGHLSYALDDTYITMAVARNVARYGVYGATRYGYTSLSSTPFWVLFLAGNYWLEGGNELAPLLWNVVFAVLVVVMAYAILTHFRVSAGVKCAALLAIILLLPLPVLVLTGMEHTLQALLTLTAAFLAARVSSALPGRSTRRDSIMLLLLTPIVTTTRFEGVFLIGAAGALLFLRGSRRLAIGLGVLGVVPVLLQGAISAAHGWFWFPTSLLQKASLPNPGSAEELLLSVLNPIYANSRVGLHTLALLIAVLLGFIYVSRQGGREAAGQQAMGAIAILLWLTHLEFVGVTPLYRYDAHLCALSIVYLASLAPLVAPGLPRLGSVSTWRVPANAAAALLALLLFLPLGMKAWDGLRTLPQCTTNIYEQQYQMGLFVRQYYQGASVALNDIGAVNYLADIHCLDLAGLATPEINAAVRHRAYQSRDIQRLTAQTGTRLAIIYDHWFVGKVPPEWIRVGRWTIPRNVIAAGDTVSFYATDPAEAPHLASCLRDFALRLPHEVMQSGAYLVSDGGPTPPAGVGAR